MPIVVPTELAQAQDALREALQYLIGRPSNPIARSLESAGATLDQLQSTQPHPTYGIAVGEVAQGRFLEAAQPVAWRYLLVSPGPMLVAAADAGAGGPQGFAMFGGDAPAPTAIGEAFVATDANGKAIVTGVGQGPTVSATVDAVAELEQVPSVQTADYELRYLEIPILSFYALWLHGVLDDMVRPIAPTPTTLADRVVMSPSQLLPSLQSAAQAVLDEQSNAQGDDAGG